MSPELGLVSSSLTATMGPAEPDPIGVTCGPKGAAADAGRPGRVIDPVATPVVASPGRAAPNSASVATAAGPTKMACYGFADAGRRLHRFMPVGCHAFCLRLGC